MAFPTSLKVQNTNGYLNFTGDGTYTCDSKLHKIYSDGFYTLNAKDYILIENQNSNSAIDINSHNSSLNLTSGLNTDRAINLFTSNISGGIQIRAANGGINTYTRNGNIDFFAEGSNINIGVAPPIFPASYQTQNINIECFNNLSANAADMHFVSSDVISFVSATGDIEFGTSTETPVIKLQNGNLLVNQSGSILDRQLDVAVTRESSSAPGYNGIVVNSFTNTVASDLTLQTSNSISDQQCILSMGAFPAYDNYAAYQNYFGYQTDNIVIRLDGPAYSPNRSQAGFGLDFTTSDVGRKLYWPLDTRTTTIEYLSSLITPCSDLSNVTVTGTYTGASSRVYLLQIDSAVSGGGPNTFMWSNDGGNTFLATFIPIEAGPHYLEQGISIEFTATSGYSLNQQFTFQTKIIAHVSDIVAVPSTPIGTPFYSLQPYFAYLGTTTASDLVIKTNNKEKLRITADGAIGIQKNNPSACLDLDSNYNKILIVNQTTPGYQINPSVSYRGSGGYVIVWNNEIINSVEPNVFDVYAQIYMTDGTRYLNNFKVNNISSNYQSFPSVACNRSLAISSKYSFAIAWASNSSVSGNYEVFAQIFNNDNVPLHSYDILIGSGGPSTDKNNQPYPRIAGLYNGDYIITWVNYDPVTQLSSIKARKLTENGGLRPIISVSNPTATLSRNYPYVAGLPANDPYLPNGFVVGFMCKVNNTLPNDNRYTISVRLFDGDSNNTPASSEIPITTVTGSAAYTSITDGLLSIAEINNNSVNISDNGGFIISFYRNYLADTTLYNITDGLIGTQSGASARISATYPESRIITLQNVSNRFLVGEEILISSTVLYVGNSIEKIAAITFLDPSTANITLDNGYRSVVAYRYKSNMTSAASNIWNTQVNTSPLFQDLDRINVPSNSTVFEYKRPLAATAINNNGTAIVSWSNGSIPSIYYQLIDVNTGAFINTEQRLTSQYDGLKQRNQVVSHLQSVEGNDFGFIISWDNQDLDLSGAGVYQQLIGYDHSIMRFEDGNNNIIFNHAGQMGIGTYTPAATLHIHAPPTTAFNNPANPATLTLQNTASHIITPATQQSISFLNGLGAQLGSINITNSLRYNDLYPQPGNLIGFYKFDQTEGTQVPDSSSSSINNDSPQLTYVNTNGILVNFDVENCWVAGLINNALAFNGDRNYVFVESTATNGLNTVLETAKHMSISVWVNVGSNVVVGSTMDIVSNGGDLSLPGGYLLSLQADPGSSDLYVFANIIVDTVPPSPSLSSGVNINVQSTTPINDGNWHLINMTADISDTGTNALRLYIDGNLVNSSDPFDNTLAYLRHGLVATTIGIRTIPSSPPLNTYFRGYMDELRFYNSVLSQSEITQLYTYGSQQLGSVIIAANGHNNINLSQVIDDTGKFNNLNCKPLPYSVISGTITAYRDDTNISGVSTQFTKELAPGDIIILDTNAIPNIEYTIMSVIDDTSATLNVPGYNGPELFKTYQSILRKPNIFSFFDNGDNIQGYINSYGNLTLGNGTSTSKLEIVSSTDNVNALPELTITNTDPLYYTFSRKTAINFASYNANNPLGPSVNLAQIAVSHYNDNINDNSCLLQIKINDGTEVLPVISVTSNGNVGIGNNNNPLAQLHMIQRNPLESCTMMLESDAPKNNAIFDEKSYLYFAGSTSKGETLSTNVNNRMLSAICGSNDGNTLSLDGRIDIMTNNLSNNENGLESRMTITSSGHVGIGIQKPINTFQVGPELRIGDNVVNKISSVASQYNIELDQNIFSNYNTPVKRQYLIGATVVVGNATLTTAKITAITGNQNMTVDTDFTGYEEKLVYISLAGLNASSSGFVGINTTTPNTALQVNGGLSLGIYNTSDRSFDLADDNSIVTLVCNSSAYMISVYLPSTTLRNLKGRMYTFKNIGGYGIVIYRALVDIGVTYIDGADNTGIVDFNGCIRLQCDGTQWWII
uniref:LamG-like jellyroll fold domain-containing protein n=1 Tax=viral metagenome TaxID=1070528 RepID=A0A6C0HMX0_9ZZZZ